MSKDLTGLRINIKAEQRRRLALKRYFNKDEPIEFVGYLDEVKPATFHLRKKLTITKPRYWCLAVDLHQVDVGKFDKIALNHVHFSTHNKKMLNLQHKFIHFKANVYTYKALYHDKNEVRYGLCNIQLLNMVDDWVNGLDVKYANELSGHQNDCLLAIRHYLLSQRMVYHMPDIAPLDRQVNGILHMKELDTFAKKTAVLSKLANDLDHGKSVKDLTKLDKKVIGADVVQQSPNSKKDAKVSELQAQVNQLEKKVRFDRTIIDQQNVLLASYLNRLTKFANQNKTLSFQNATFSKQKPFTKAVLKLAELFHHDNLKPDEVVSKPEAPVAEAVKQETVDEDALKKLKAKLDSH